MTNRTHCCRARFALALGTILRHSLVVYGLLSLTMTPFTAVTAAEPLRAYTDGQTPQDTRLGPLKDLNGYFPFDPPATRAARNQDFLILPLEIQ